MVKDNKNVVVGLDIGTSKIVAIVAELTPDGELNVIGLGTQPSRGLRKGVVVNIDATMASIQRVLEEAELVSARREGDWLTLEVSDTGVGMAAGVKASGFGVAQVRERLATTYGTHATIYFVAPNEGGTMAIARLPYEDTQTT